MSDTIDMNMNTPDLLEQWKNEYIRTLTEMFTGTPREKGILSVLDWLANKTDFYTAPASTKFHGDYEGGLVQHSLDVYELALKMVPMIEEEMGIQLSRESIAIAALFHDVCKVNFYKKSKRNQKIDGAWREVDYYTIEEQMHFGGHGSKSVYLISHIMRLTEEEAIAINCHMGFADMINPQPVSQAYGQYPLAWLIHAADEAATFIRKR